MYDASEADMPVRVMAQRQRLHLTRGSSRSWVSTATRHSGGASIFCQRIVSTLCHVNWPHRVFNMSLASAMFVGFSARRSLCNYQNRPVDPWVLQRGIPPIPLLVSPRRNTGSLSVYKTNERAPRPPTTTDASWIPFVWSSIE